MARILIIESEGREQEDLAGGLKEAGHAVEVAGSARAALASVVAGTPDMILLDSSIGADEGTRFIQGLKARGSALALPVIVLAENGDASAVMEGRGASDVVRRPRTGVELADKVEILLEVLHLRQELAARNAELQCLTTQLAHILEMKNRFLDLATHDIRTPVTTIKLVGDIFEKQLMPDGGVGVRRLLDILTRNVAKIEAKIEELLLIARLDMDDIQIKIGNVDLNAVVEDAVASFFPGAISRGIDLDAVLTDVPTLRGDARRIGQLASELISCALERLDTGQRVMVETCRDRDGVVIRVTDNGLPIGTSQIEEMLAGLANEDPSRQTRASLYAAYQIARRHGGRLDLHSGTEPDGGVVFAAWLPLDAAQATLSAAEGQA